MPDEAETNPGASCLVGEQIACRSCWLPDGKWSQIFAKASSVEVLISQVPRHTHPVVPALKRTEEAEPCGFMD